MIPGPKILNLGLPGAGKTYSLRTIPGPFQVIFTENSHTTLSDLPASQVKWMTMSDNAGSFSDLQRLAHKIGNTSMDELRKWRDPHRKHYDQFYKMLGAFQKFVDEREGTDLGGIEDWPPEAILALDSLTPINEMIGKCVSGGRIMREQSEWGVMVSQQRQFIEALCSLKCSVIVNAHLSMDRDPDTGAVYMMSPVAITRNYSTEIARNFDEVIYSEKIGKNFVWNTASTKVATKARLLPIQENLPQNYSLIYDTWNRKRIEAEGEPK